MNWIRRKWSYLILLFFVVAIVFVTVVYMIWSLGIASAIGDVVSLLRHAVRDDRHEAVRNYAYTLGGAVATVVILVSMPIQLIRVWINERNTKTAEQGHITDRLNTAIEHLGATKTVKIRERTSLGLTPELPDDAQSICNPTERPEHNKGSFDVWKVVELIVPNLEVRLGALYALERIALDSERDHIPVMQALCAYIRVNASTRKNAAHDFYWELPQPFKVADEHETSTDAKHTDLEAWIEALPSPREDIQVALDIIGRRPIHRVTYEQRQKTPWGAKSFWLDLNDTNLRKANLVRANLEGCLLRGAMLEGANLGRANLNGAYLFRAHLAGAYLGHATLEKADIKEADLSDWVCSKGPFRSDQYVGENNLEWSQVDSAIRDNVTVLPEHLERAISNSHS